MGIRIVMVNARITVKNNYKCLDMSNDHVSFTHFLLIVIFENFINDLQVTGEGFACPLEGSQTLELNSAVSVPINFNILGTIIQGNFRMFVQYTGMLLQC